MCIATECAHNIVSQSLYNSSRDTILSLSHYTTRVAIQYCIATECAATECVQRLSVHTILFLSRYTTRVVIQYCIATECAISCHYTHITQCYHYPPYLPKLAGFPKEHVSFAKEPDKDTALFITQNTSDTPCHDSLYVDDYAYFISYM